MKRLIYLALGIMFAAPALAAEEPQGADSALTDPVEILKRMDAAAKAVKSVAYDIEFDATGDLAKIAAQGKGSVLMTGWTGRWPERFKVDVEVSKPNGGETRHVTGGADGENYYLIDHASTTAFEDIDPKVMGSAEQIVNSALVNEFVHEEPFNDEINGKNHVLRASEKVGDVDCYVVALEYANAPQKATWYIGKGDFLPRRRVDALDQPGIGKGEIRKTITRLVVAPKFEEDTFKLKVPDGFRKTDDFAP